MERRKGQRLALPNHGSAKRQLSPLAFIFRWDQKKKAAPVWWYSTGAASVTELLYSYRLPAREHFTESRHNR
jgi:hypothetical protein